MRRNTALHKIAFVADYIPRKCGIATFTADLLHAVAGQYPSVECFVCAVSEPDRSYDYPPEVRFEIEEEEPDSYRRAADFLNFSNADVVCLQHEYGIFGGRAGGYVLRLLRDLRIPVVTTLHTILREPDPDQYRVLREIISLSARVVTMTEKGRCFLRDVYGVPDDKIDLIPHGIPDMPFVDPNFYKDQFGVEGKYVLLTFGLLSPNKGIEYVLRALPQIVEVFPDTVYIVLGATHPNLVREQGETYRLSLERLARDLGIEKHVIFYNRFVDIDELKEFLGAADIYITPYLNPAQITSGTLSYAFGCGKAVISTPYWHAEELLAEGRGILVPFADSEAIAREVIGLLQDPTRRHAMRKRAYMLGREMVWSHVAHMYVESFEKARRSRWDNAHRPLAIKTLEQKPRELPTLRLDHLRRLTDSTGLLQHSTYALPNYAEGYCSDDNARALLLTINLEGIGHEIREAQRLGVIYAAFLNNAFDRKTGRFRNFMGYDRRWLEETGSDDCQGRVIWALGACVGRSRDNGLRMWAAGLLERVLTTILDTTSPRGWAFALVGIHEYFRQLSGDRLVNQVRETLTQRLIALYDSTASDDWPWFEPVVSYDNAKLPHALILSGRWGDNPKAFDIGLKTLRWLAELQTAEAGHFRPIGSNGFYPRGGECARFDQQPIEAYSMLSACLEAYRSTNDEYWLQKARAALDWFLGRNDLGMELVDYRTGGCRDGLHVDRVNQNQGAESTLAFLLSLTEMKLQENLLGDLIPIDKDLPEWQPSGR
jgi:glycosyltransferase involved in cell wall biosynthesis